ncbi:MAG: DNA translocase FtsK [Planctomycetaceae bacterium]|jgi:S-DNA-T family DNA segregation ATPase FtsK/SpoIIIE|nr:DNA translocase FtsK [Planctomycetaceae bacterium]
MKPLGLRFLGVVVSTLFVVFAISVLSYSPDDIPIASVLTEPNVDASAEVATNTPDSNSTSTYQDSTDSSKVSSAFTSSSSSSSSLAPPAKTPPTNSPPFNSPTPNNTPSPFINPFAVNNTFTLNNPVVAPNYVNNTNIVASNILDNKSIYNEDDDENLILTEITPNPPRKNIKNLCGPIGVILSAVTIYLFGQSTLILLLPFGACAVKLLTINKFDQVILRTIGFIFALIGFCGLCGLFADKLVAFPLSTKNPGGLIGTIIAAALNQNVAVAGSVVLLLSLIIGGFILFADRILLQTATSLISLLNNTSSENPHPSRPSSSSVPDSPHDQNCCPDKPVLLPLQLMSVYDTTSERLSSRPVVSYCRDNETNRIAYNYTEHPDKDNCQPQLDKQNNKLVKKITESKNIAREYKLPSTELLTKPEIYNDNDFIEESEHQAIQIEEVFKTFNLQVEVVDVQTGPTVSQFELQLAKGLRINKIQQLADDLGLALRVPKVRVVNPIPGKNTLGVELPNKHRRIVRMREIIEESDCSYKTLGIPLFLGKDVSGKPMISDLATLTHLLIAGRTGTGKSVCLNSIIISILMTRTPNEVRMIMIDPKSVELSPYQNIPHLIHPVVIDMSKTEAVLAWVVEKMQERYRLLNAARVVHINDYNKLSESELRRRMELLDCSDEEWQVVPKSLPRLVIIIDEFGELMSSVAPKEIESHIIRLAQKSRAVGIHLILATQKPTVDVITGLIKSNLPARISFGVATRADSMVILDQTGAERLLGCGDMLFLNSDKNEINRGQGTFVDREDIDEIVNTIKIDTPNFIEELVEIDEDESGGTDNYGNNVGITARTRHKDNSNNFENELHDELYEKAVEYVIGEGRGSTSLLQRKLSVGYGRAAKMIETMETEGIVGPYNGSQAREVIMTLNDWYKLSAKKNNRSASATKQLSANLKPVQKVTPKVLSEVLASGRTKNPQKQTRQSGTVINTNVIRHAVPVSSELNFAESYNNNEYFDPNYENNNNNQEGYIDGSEFAS